jgi:DnaJ-class molecular chaperone
MGILNTVSDWFAARHERRVLEMESLGRCPMCNGRGFNSFSMYEYYYAEPVECAGCYGSGNYSDWHEGNE